MWRLRLALGWLAIAWWGEAFTQAGFLHARLLVKAMMLPAFGFPGILLVLKFMLDEKGAHGGGFDFEVVLISLFGGSMVVFFAAFPFHMLLTLLPFELNMLSPWYFILSVLVGLLWLTNTKQSTEKGFQGP